MRTKIFTLLQIGLAALGLIVTNKDIVIAQVTSDGTVNTQVNQNGSVAEITGGETRGSNLFHSFQDFSVGTGNEAFFNNANDISNIFSRVTGGNISNIDGAIRADGNASLFLINPAGIIFGEGASLDIGGSFLGSTATSILFEDGEFSATDLDSPPLLTISVPIGLGLEVNPGEIVNRSTVEDSEANPVGLEVLSGNNLSFVGGNIKFEGGKATAKGGTVELGGLLTAGTIEISEDGSLIFPKDVAKADITLSNGAVVDVRSAGSGNITVNASNLDLTENSELRAGIGAESTSTNARAGDIEIDLTDSLNLDNSNITNTVKAEGAGNSGNINITAGSIKATNRGQVDTNTFGKGNGGNINITATGDITFNGENDNLESGVISLVLPGAEGDAGNITIFTQGNLSLTDGGRIDASTSALGNGGNINITATGDITFDGEDLEQLGSGAVSLVNPEAEGDAGNITIFTQGNLSLTDGGRIDASTSAVGNGGNINITANEIIFSGEKNSKGFESGAASQVREGVAGDAGNITISTQGNFTLTDEVRIDTTNNGIGSAGDITISTQKNLTVNDGGQINANANGRGNGGNINITSIGDITFAGDDDNGDGSGATSLVGRGVAGDAGNITISTQGNLSLTDGGRVDASSNKGEGNAGLVDIIATGDITFGGEDSRGFGSGATSQVNPGVEQGNSGGISIFTQGNLTFKDGGRVDTSTNAPGNAGLVDITALGDITFEGKALNGDGSGATSQVNPQAAGNAGGVTISTQGNLTLTDGGRIDVSINARGDRENVVITNAETQSATVDNANINLQVAKNIISENDSLISARASENANGGNLTIDSKFIIAFPNGNNDIIASAERGRGGNITINAKSLFGIEKRLLNNSTNDINASSEFSLDGTVVINTPDINLQRELEQSEVDFLTVEQAIANSCLARSSGQTSFTIGGDGGFPKNPDSNYSDANFSLTGVGSLPSTKKPPSPTQANNSRYNQSIIPAEKIVETENGRIYLVAAPQKAKSFFCQDVEAK